MIKILCIETATEVCSVALFSNNDLLYHKSISEGNMHASHLHLLVQDVLLVAGIDLKKIHAIAVSKGPGSYTGLRVGAATAKGLCYALTIPLIAIDTLKSLAFGFLNNFQSNQNQLFIPMLDAKRMEVYTAVYTNNLFALEPTHAKIIDENSFSSYTDKELIFFGNGAQKCQSILESKIPQSTFLNFQCNASYLGILAQQAYKNNTFEDLAFFEPFYLKDFVTTKPKNN